MTLHIRPREHGLFLALFTIGLAIRVLATVAYRPALLLQSDAYVYLQKAVDLEPSRFRPVFYSLFLKPFVLLHQLSLAVVAQHLIGLALAVFVYMYLQRMGVTPTWSALGSAPLLLDAYQVNIEQYILAETLFQVLSAGAVVILMWKRSSTKSAVLAAGILIGLCALTRFVGVVLLLPVAVYVWRRVGWKGALAVCGAAAVPMFAYALWFSSVYGELAITTSDGAFLYGRVASWVDCDQLQIPRYQRVLCDPRPPEKRPDANAYVFGEPPGGELRPPPGISHDAALRDFALSGISQQTLPYLEVVGGGMLHYFAPERSTGPQDNRLVQWRFPTAASDTEPHAFLIRKYKASPPPAIDSARFSISQRPASILIAYQSFAYTHGPLLFAICVLAVIGIAIPRRDSEEVDLRPDIALLTVSGLLLLLVPIATVTFDYRFMLLALPLLPAAAVLSAHRIRTIRASG